MGLKTELRRLRPQFAMAARGVYDEWEQDDDGWDEEYGEGGICHDIADAIVGVVYDNLSGVEAYSQDSGGIGEQHVWAVAYTDDEAFLIDISPAVYETGSGYTWRKRVDVEIETEDVYLEEIDRDEIVEEY
jgi:hypothetical protein